MHLGRAVLVMSVGMMFCALPSFAATQSMQLTIQEYSFTGSYYVIDLENVLARAQRAWKTPTPTTYIANDLSRLFAALNDGQTFSDAKGHPIIMRNKTLIGIYQGRYAIWRN